MDKETYGKFLLKGISIEFEDFWKFSMTFDGHSKI